MVIIPKILGYIISACHIRRKPAGICPQAFWDGCLPPFFLQLPQAPKRAGDRGKNQVCAGLGFCFGQRLPVPAKQG
jgi:hypothetical protein